MADMAKENMHVDQLLHLKPNVKDLFYPTIPTYEERKENSYEEEDRKKEIRNERRKVDWENECKHIRNRGQTNTNDELCLRCWGIFTPGHINPCTVKQARCSICKNTGHFAKNVSFKNTYYTTTTKPTKRKIRTSPGTGPKPTPGQTDTRRNC